MERESYRCVRCGASLGHGWPGYSCHHRQLRSGGGRTDLNNLIMLCGSGTTGCHAWAHSNRKDTAEAAGSEQLGYIVSRYQNPECVPVWHHLFGWVIYDSNGGTTTQPQMPPPTPEPQSAIH